MITTAFISIALFVVNLILAIFPNSSGFPPAFDLALTDLGGYIGIFSPIFPIATMATILAMVIAFELAIFAFKGVKWLFSFVPLFGGRG